LKYLAFDGREYSIQPNDYIIYKDDTRVKSSLHLLARKLVKEFYPVDIILEEVTLPIYNDRVNVLYADFLVPSRKIIIEVHGEQHYIFNPFFHKNKIEFAKAKVRDSIKKEWCELNSITLLELPYNESEQQWREKFG
jgi:hypothetical protein